jgi:hypothetical protein
MIGYIYHSQTRVISTKIKDIKACNDTTIKGEGMAMIGTGQYVITGAEYSEGDVLPVDVVDKRVDLPVLPIQY